MQKEFLAFVIGVAAALSFASGMRQIPGGMFKMGQPNPDLGGDGWSEEEQPFHKVTVSPFSMDTTEVTQGSFQHLMGFNPSHFAGDTLRPVEEVTWFDAVLYCNARSKADGFDTVYLFASIKRRDSTHTCIGLSRLTINYSKNGYRLPTEAEWEYACRAGSTTGYYWGKNYPAKTAADSAVMDSNAVWWGNSNHSTAKVASKLPNAWGLYDMAGNVWEWCNDWYGNYASGTRKDPTGPPSVGKSRAWRGGSWYNLGYYLRSAYRDGGNPAARFDDVGFRCVRR